MLEHEYAELPARLGAARGERTAFFAFADTVATRSYRHPGSGRGWESGGLRSPETLSWLPSIRCP